MRDGKHGNLWPLFSGIALALFTAYVLLDAFVIPRSYATVKDSAPRLESSDSAGESSGGTSVGSLSTRTVTSESQTSETQTETSETQTGTSDSAAVTENSYEDDNISIKLTQYRENDTDIYVADVTVSDISYLRAAFADDTYGKNITETTSSIASRAGAILAINGDYYGARSGYVIRNGTLYRDKSSGAEQQDLAIYGDGSFKIVSEGDASASELYDGGAWQVLSFGPGLLSDGEITVTESDEVDRAKTSNPRTAIGEIAPLHYVFVVADGRTSESAGLSLYQLAEFMQTLGVETAYNLDGGGSSTMVFNGTVINNPTTGGKRSGEREVSDIVYIG